MRAAERGTAQLEVIEEPDTSAGREGQDAPDRYWPLLTEFVTTNAQTFAVH